MNTKKIVNVNELKLLYRPPAGSHKGQNGRLLIIGGSKLFHAASLWALQVASRIVDLVHYSSVEENNILVQKLKKEFRNGIVIDRHDIEEYIEEDDCILIGPGLVRTEEIQNSKSKFQNKFKIQNLNELEEIRNEGEQTRELTHYLLTKYPKKQWVIDAGALQMLALEDIPVGAILTPHKGEFENLWGKAISGQLAAVSQKESSLDEKIKLFAKTYRCIVLVKGERDIVCDGRTLSTSEVESRVIAGGNAGMTKGGTGDVLAGLIAALATKNDPMLAATAGSFLNKQAGEALFKKVGPFFNASDLASQIPETMKKLLL